jgi:hypothetical protein
MTVNFVFLFLESGAILGLECCVAKQLQSCPEELHWVWQLCFSGCPRHPEIIFLWDQFSFREQKKVCCSDPVNNSGGWSPCCVEVFTSYNSVLLFPICETVCVCGTDLVQNFFCPESSWSICWIVSWWMCSWCSVLMVFGHQVTNFCNWTDHHRGPVFIF